MWHSQRMPHSTPFAVYSPIMKEPIVSSACDWSRYWPFHEILSARVFKRKVVIEHGCSCGRVTKVGRCYSIMQGVGKWRNWIVEVRSALQETCRSQAGVFEKSRVLLTIPLKKCKGGEEKSSSLWSKDSPRSLGMILVFMSSKLARSEAIVIIRL